MQTTGLGSRFAPPRIVHSLVARTELFDQLVDALGVVSVLTGPPGSARTTVMSSCYQALDALAEPVRWVNLSYADNDPQILQAHLKEAFTPALTTLGNFPEAVSGFIDGVRWLDNPQAIDLLERFVLTVPVNSRVVLCVGTLKMSQLSRAQLSGLVRIVGVKALHFTDAQAGELLGACFTPTQVRQINAFVDGWPAGLRFFERDLDACFGLLQLKHGLVRLPQGMAEYIEAQFAQQLDEAQLNALMELSVLQRFTPELVVDVPEPCSHWALVENFLVDGWSIRYIDSQQHWCEVNPALACYFAQRLKRFAPTRFHTLKLFTIQWLSEHNYPQEAARHAASLDKPSVAASVLEQAGPIALDLGAGLKVQLPELLAVEQAGQYPLLFIGQLYARIRAGKLAEAHTLFEQAWQLTEGFSQTANPDDSEEVISWGLIYRYVFKYMLDTPISADELQDLHRHTDRWLIKEPVMSACWASLFAYGLCEARSYERASLVCNNALQLSQLQSEARISVFLWIHRSVATLALGQLDEAAQCAESACQIALQEDSASYEQINARMWRAVVYFYQGQQATALNLLNDVLDKLSQTSGWVPMYAHGYAVAVECACLANDFAHAKQLITHGERFAQMRGLRRLSAYLVIIKLNYLVRSKAWREALQLHASDSFASLLYNAPASAYEGSTYVLATLASAQLMLQLGRPAQALEYLQALDGDVLKQLAYPVQTSVALLKARAYFSVRRYSMALTCALQVYELASYSQFAQLIGVDYSALYEVLAWAKNRGKSLPEGLWRWFEQHGQAVDNLQVTHKGQQLLSPRESEVLLLVAEGLTNKEVAQTLKISEGTVKGHRKRIHEKLQVTSRSQAINKARELLLI